MNRCTATQFTPCTPSLEVSSAPPFSFALAVPSRSLELILEGRWLLCTRVDLAALNKHSSANLMLSTVSKVHTTDGNADESNTQGFGLNGLFSNYIPRVKRVNLVSTKTTCQCILQGIALHMATSIIRLSIC